MKALTPPKSKAVVQQDAYEVKVTMPSWKHWWPKVFLPIWLMGWVVAAVATSLQAAKEPGAALMAVLTAGVSVCGLVYWLFMCFGHEVLLVTHHQLWHRYELFGWFYTRVYAAQDIRRLRSVEHTIPWGQWPQGAMAFDWGSKTVRMAAGIDTAEAHTLLELLGTRLSQAD
ncbi:MAG TPA: hypothetical protein VGO93_02340 [Candidatus Xenobia bacterium]|jgi:hypothetical protein